MESTSEQFHMHIPCDKSIHHYCCPNCHCYQLFHLKIEKIIISLGFIQWEEGKTGL
jgi:hypothetical protein